MPEQKQSCELCEAGFPRNDEYWQHYGTESLGMITNTPCKMLSPEPQPVSDKEKSLE